MHDKVEKLPFMRTELKIQVELLSGSSEIY